MYVLHMLTSVLGLTLLLGTGAFAEIQGGEPGTSSNPKDNVPAKIQRSTPSAENFPGGSGPGERSDALTGMKHEKPVKEGAAELEQNVGQTGEGGAAMAAEDLEQKSHGKSSKGISSESSTKSRKKH